MNNEDSATPWSKLSLFLSHDILKRRYQDRHGRDLSAAKAKEIISHLEQARQYFTSAQSAGVLAGPLEQYYGVLAFSRAIILYLNPSLRETSLKPGHGLHAHLPSDGSVEDIQLEVRGGTFDELLDATGNFELATYDDHTAGIMIPNLKQAVRTLPRPPTGSTFSLLDLLGRIPELRQHFEEALLRPALCYAGYVHLLMGALSVTIWRQKYELPALEILRDQLKIDRSASAMVSPNESAVFTVQLSVGNSAGDFLPSMFTSRSGEHFLVERFPGGWALSEIASYFAASHVLSMLVRYYPSRWASMVNHEKGDHLLPVLERMRTLIQSEFARLVMWVLEETPLRERETGSSEA